MNQFRKATISMPRLLVKRNVMTRNQQSINAASTGYYIGSVIITFIGLSFAAVPLYQMFCSQTGYDGTPKIGAGTKFLLRDVKPIKNAKKIRINFDSSVSDQMHWKFQPEVKQISVLPGDTALAFFKAKNNTEESIIGVVPYKAAQYFNKIQCFCFEEQRLEPGEEVEMPVFFFLDPEFSTDPWMQDVNDITLHYTFFRSKYQ